MDFDESHVTKQNNRGATQEKVKECSEFSGSIMFQSYLNSQQTFAENTVLGLAYFRETKVSERSSVFGSQSNISFRAT